MCVFAKVIARFVEVVGQVPGLLKADVKSAFSRIPIDPEHRWACGVAFKVFDQIYISMHASCPFGAVASVHAWERVGAAITHIVKKFLKIALLRYVDDLFGPERCDSRRRSCTVSVLVFCVFVYVRKETMQHALECVARLIRVLLGPTAVAEDKLACGMKLDVLGVSTCAF